MKAYLRKTTETYLGWFRSKLERKYVQVTILGIGARHKGSYAAQAWDYRDVLVQEEEAPPYQVSSSDLFTSQPIDEME